MAHTNDHAATSSSPAYTIVRDTNYLDRMFYTQHRIGAHSNILVSAHYTKTTPPHESGNGLSEAAVYSSLHSIINTYPELALTGVPVRSPGETKHKLHLAALHEIDLTSCVEFRDGEPPHSTHDIIEGLHNEWDLTTEKSNPRKPWWKVVVLGRREVIFVAHHLVCDGRFGTIFHNDFLKSLNAWDPNAISAPRVITIDPQRTRLEPHIQAFWTTGQFMIWTLFDLLRHMLMHAVLGRWLMFSGHSPPHQLPKHPFPSESEIKYKPRTLVTSTRISSSTMSSILGACRGQGTTFTTFLSVVMLSVLADEHYPTAWLGGSYCATDMRKVYPKTAPGTGQLISCGGGTGHMLRLGRFRGIFSQSKSNQAKNKLSIDTAGHVDVARLWTLTRNYRSWLTQEMSGNDPEALQIYRINNAGSVYLEDLVSQMLPAMGWYQQAACSVSNLGAFTVSPSDRGLWTIDDLSFSAAAVHGSISYKLCVNVAGVKGGDTVLNACFEEGVLARNMVDDVLKVVIQRMEHVSYSTHS